MCSNESSIWRLTHSETPYLVKIDTLIQSHLRPTSHVIIEPHPDVLAHMRECGWYDKPGVKILEGKWQDFIESEELMSEGFDVIYTDTFSEQYSGSSFFPSLVSCGT